MNMILGYKKDDKKYSFLDEEEMLNAFLQDVLFTPLMMITLLIISNYFMTTLRIII